MIKFKEVEDETGEIIYVETPLKGRHLLTVPELNKGCAFSREEREDFNLTGRLPHRIETLEEQVARMYRQYSEQPDNIQKNIFLNNLNDFNETLFYRLVSEHLEEMLPVLYTPTVGDVVESFSLELRRPRGMYLPYSRKGHLRELLQHRVNNEVDLIVVTDGEGVLGIGDQGIGGVNIAIAKLMVYTLCAGINPHRVLPIQLDVGTNNQKLLDDPLYLGLRHPRISGAEYDEFIDEFVTEVRAAFPDIYLHWEDFGRDNARRNLERYRPQMCTFNDDMQGTGIVTLSNVLAGVNAIGSELKEQRFVVLGAGTAGVGITDQLCDALCRSGLSKEEAQARFWLVDRYGLIVDNQANLPSFQQPYARSANEIAEWGIDGVIGLAEVVDHVHPTVLIGCSTVHGAFTESIVKNMASHTQHPIIMPLSNPTKLSEAEPKDLIEWTEGRAIVAAGSPFPPVHYQDEVIRISQGNNAFVFPGLGLGVIVAKAKRMTDGMIWAAAQALSQCSPSRKDRHAPLLPSFDDVMDVSHKVAEAVAKAAIEEGVAGIDADADLQQRIRHATWKAEYHPYQYVP